MIIIYEEKAQIKITFELLDVLDPGSVRQNRV